MTPDRARDLERICDAALERPVAERVSFVAEACGDDEVLRREVESLLLLDQAPGATGFLSTPAWAMAGSARSDNPPTTWLTADGPRGAPNDASRLVPGQQFGPYRIERLLGRGGMGEVYEAEHLEHGRRVAVKVLSRRLNDPADRARFLREGQLAASVSHPHVVYVYGSEEIAGTPVITMELLRGGTLQERIGRGGPLAPIEAIDAILQIVSGLEAAQAAGILHRDIKPSNCFVDADGTIKIGDFGLSIPVLARDVTQVTTRGTFQGTPTFASPEHLRGQPLDVRSDIYAVGATLHCLLTGRPPFDDRNLMALVSRIATEPPPSLRTERSEIPKVLAATVLQCLAKDPAHRPASYRSLAHVLEPLSSSIKTSAPLGMRVAAGFMDGFFSQFVLLLPVFVFLARAPPAFGARPIWDTLVEVAYFAIAESLWGASPGKALCGLRVVTDQGTRPRFARALLRALVFVAPRWLASGLALSVAGPAYSEWPGGPWIVLGANTVVCALLFAPARRANGFMGIHEWASDTRTVLKSSHEGLRIERPAPSPIELPASPQRVGPYVLVHAHGAQPNGGAALGYDERLRRTVWLRFPAVESDSVPLTRRLLRRPARPHWLAGQRTGGLAWDAYEQVPGQSFDTVLTQAQSWGTVRGWLCDLAEEVRAGLRDGSLPAVELDRIWIGDDGRARLLDWPVPSDRSASANSAPLERPVEWPQAQRFLHRVAVSALEGPVLADAHPHGRTTRVPLPRSAADCLATLGHGHFASPEDMVTALASAARGPAAVSRTKRAAHVSLCAIPAIFMLVFGVFSLYNRRSDVASAPYVRSVVAGEVADRAGLKVNDVVVTLDGEPMALAAQLGAAIRRHPDERITLSILRDGRPLTIGVTPVRRANQGLIGIEVANEKGPAINPTVVWRYVWLHVMVGLMLAATLGLFSALAARGGLALRLMRMAVVTTTGTLASGPRVWLRASLSWLPVLAASAAAVAGHAPLLTLTAQAAPFFAISPGLPPVFPRNLPPIFFLDEPSIFFVRVAIIAVALAVFAVGVMTAVVRPERGLQDRLAGTWLVPR